MNQTKTKMRRLAVVVAGLISALLAAPVAMGAGWVVYEGLHGRNYSDVGVVMYEHGGIAQAAGLGVLLMLVAGLLVFIHDLARSRVITTFAALWALPWIGIYLLGTAMAF